MLHRIISLLLIVSSLSCNFHRCSVVFSRSWTSLAGVLKMPYQTLFQAHRYETIKQKQNKHNKLFMLKRNVHSNTPPQFALKICLKREPLAVYVILEIFCTVSLKAHDWSSWILTECNLSWKIIKYSILSEVCMINSTEVCEVVIIWKSYMWELYEGRSSQLYAQLNSCEKKAWKNLGLYGIRTLDLCDIVEMVHYKPVKGWRWSCDYMKIIWKFSGFLFATAKVAYITAMIFLHIILIEDDCYFWMYI